MRRTPIRSILSLGFLLLAAGCAHVPANNERFASMDAMLETQARELALPGVSAALMERGRLVWTGARGWADVEARRPVTPETTFNIASLTKPMTAVHADAAGRARSAFARHPDAALRSRLHRPANHGRSRAEHDFRKQPARDERYAV